VHVLELALVARAAGRFQIDELAAGHAAYADGLGQHSQHLHPCRVTEFIGPCRQHAKGQRLQGIARQYGRAFIESLVAGRAAAAQIIVIHRRQIVVDQAVGVNQLHRGRRSVQIGLAGIECGAGNVHQQRP
jgi:hypothetical protein